MNNINYILLFALLFPSCGNRSERNRTSENIQYPTEDVVLENVFVEDLSNIVTVPIYSSTSNYSNNLSAVASDIEFVPLSIDPPLGEPFFLRHIELGESHIFLSWLTSIYSYDRSGVFIRNIGQSGRGPQEFVEVSTIQIDRENELLYAVDHRRRRMIVYRFDGILEKTFPIKGGEPVLLNSTTTAWRQTITNREDNLVPLIAFTTNDGEEIKTLWSSNLPLPPREGRRLLGPDTSPLWFHNDNFYYIEWGSDTVFRISGNTLEPVRVLTGDLKLSLAGHFEIESGRRLRIATPIGQVNSGIFESNHFMILRLENDSERFFTVYNKETKELHRTHHRDAPTTRRGEKRMDYFVDDMFTGLNLNPMYQSMGKAIAVIPAHEIYDQKQKILDFIENNPNDKSRHLKQIVEKITDDCNPVLAIITFR
jgi:hypothetical protein